MAFSMFLRNTACFNKAFSQQAMRLATQPSMQRTTLAVSFKNVLPKDAKVTTPLLNAVRTFRTTAMRRAAEAGHGDHSKLWVIEKVISALLVPLIPAALLCPSKTLDYILAVAIVAHTFWGFEAIAVDYVRPILFGPVIPKIAIGLVYVMCIATLGGLFYVINHDIGIANTIKRVWSIQAGSQVEKS